MDQQTANAAVANMLDAAKNLLKSAKQIAEENNIHFAIQDLYEDVMNEYVDWNSSSC